MRIDITKSELEIIVDCLNGQPLKCYRRLREQLAKRLGYVLHPSKAPDKDGWAPIRVSIRSSMPDGIFKPESKRDWAFHKEQKPPTTKAPKVPLTADEILSEL